MHDTFHVSFLEPAYDNLAGGTAPPAFDPHLQVHAQACSITTAGSCLQHLAIAHYCEA